MEQDAHLQLGRCPHCNVARPNLGRRTAADTWASDQSNRRYWVVYGCETCGGCILTVSPWNPSGLRPITNIWPSSEKVDNSVPQRARQFLQQAISSIHAPAGATMLAASSVDAMLKEIGLKDGSLYKRIGEAQAQHLITAEMAAWAHEVRLEANDQRHADEQADLPNEADARKSVEFVQALAQFLFVLPSRVARGRSESK
ncbi:DUF4145 domain-containing protein [Pseudomonas sp. SWI7]|nr:DUF4145 domain-containing protein [Pseudomonas sp. SWI7]QDC06367.1 DUF4145 domain-containing protein [Pseudomonas sp. SWI7]